MSRLHLFNPQNDLALAAAGATYTPPAAARAFASAGAALPAWWAAGSDIVNCPAEDAEWLMKRFGRAVSTTGTASQGAPWGWSSNAATLLVKAGLPDNCLPDYAAIGRWRTLSHRQTAIEIRRKLGVDTGACVVNERQAREFLLLHGGRVYAKSPWSCSGRGVAPLGSLSMEQSLHIISGYINRQGCALLEADCGPGLNFAALFDSRAEGVGFAGWSVFSSAGGGKYSGNNVDSQEALLQKICSHADVGALTDYVSRLETILTEIVTPSGYSGPLGIDMLANDAGLNPCIELNLRRTMGFVARDIFACLGERGMLVMTDSRLNLTPPRDGFSIGLR